jgi:hypothetical protein
MASQGRSLLHWRRLLFQLLCLPGLGDFKVAEWEGAISEAPRTQILRRHILSTHVPKELLGVVSKAAEKGSSCKEAVALRSSLPSIFCPSFVF